MHSNKLSIISQSQTYDVLFPQTINLLLEELAHIPHPIVIVDKQIADLYPNLIQQLKLFSPVLNIEATEDTKNLATAEKILAFLLEQNASKDTHLIGIGGGITQDIVSFAAHIYYRGLAFIFVPTTLLAMSDSCIGGKSGLNYFGYKNQLGAIHPPKRVLIWPGFTDSLTDDAMQSGYGEIFKMMLLGNKELYSKLCATLQHEGFRNSAIQEHIMNSLELKKKFIEEDEFDTGVRRILNYGHTFGHAIELATEYQTPHGIAVVHGINLANYIAWKKGLLSEALYLEVQNFISTHFLLNLPKSVEGRCLINHVKRDKKITEGKLHMILLEDVGKVKIEPVLMDQQLEKMIDEYVQINHTHA